MLIDKDVPLKDTDNEGDAPMHLAAKRGDKSIMCKLHTAGASPCQPGNYTIIITSLSRRYGITINTQQMQDILAITI